MKEYNLTFYIQLKKLANGGPLSKNSDVINHSSALNTIDLPLFEYHGNKGLVINYGEGGGGLQNGKIAGLKLFVPPPPSRQGKTFRAPPF